jgi:hypothetical protein
MDGWEFDGGNLIHEEPVKAGWSEPKLEYAAMNRTYCDHCGNSDADMDIGDDTCYDCLHPKETAARRKAEMDDYLYVYGEPDRE